MTKRLAPTYLEKRATTGLNLASLNLKVAAIDATHVDDVAHDFLADISGGAIVATSGNIGSKTTDDGVLDSTVDLSLGSPSSGGPITQFWLYNDTGSGATSDLIYYWNEDASAAAISISVNGEEIKIQWNASGIFR